MRGETVIDGIIVIKIGGAVRPDPVLDDIAALTAEGTGVVLVHGGGGEVDRLAARLGVPSRIIQSPDGTSSRRTDPQTLDVLAMALLGRVKPALVGGLRARGVQALGLNGADAGLLTARRKQVLRSVEDGRTVLIRDDRSGQVTEVRTGPLPALLAGGVVPVLSPPAADAQGELLNVDADQVAAQIAAALGASALFLLTDAPGVLRDPSDPGSVIGELSADAPEARGRMRHKVRAARLAAATVPTVMIGSGCVEHPVRAALAGAGTTVLSGRNIAPADSPKRSQP
ncbi:MAG TPA: [LysW]-aminoadipate kinase [Actinocrinis sp.]|nr:[LysW]-aminoadipate kinase [Actinocrinis sp.]